MIVPTYKINSQEVEEAWQAYRATQIMAAEKPALLENKYFLAIQDTAYARFLMTFEAMEIDPEVAKRLRGQGA